MAIRKIPIFDKYHILHDAYLDLPKAVKAIPTWFNNNKYDFWEKGLSEKDTGPGKELVSEWIAQREVTDYFTYDIEIKFLARDLQKVTFEDRSDGYFARLIVEIDATLVIDPDNKFSGSKWDKLMQSLYDRYIMKDKIDEYAEKLALEMVELINGIKQHLK